jgi:hypothetical protein
MWPTARTARQALGLDTRVLRCVAVERGEAGEKRVEAVFALEVLGGQLLPSAGASWVDERTLAELPLTAPQHRAIIADWLRGRGPEGEKVVHHPWVLPGWQTTAVEWVAAALARRGEGPISAVEQVRTWDLSCVLRVRTPQGARFLKALPPAYAPEVAVAGFLAAHFPSWVPTVLAVDRERGWLLADDAGPLMDNDRLDLWEAAVDQIAAMQRASIPRLDTLLALGCEDQRLDALAAGAATLLTDPHVRAVLDADEYAHLRALVPRLQDRCAALAAFGLPPTLVHGDLHTGNIAARDDRPVFFDWGDACVAHPFVVLFALLDARYYPCGAGDIGPRLRDRYLAGWSDYGSLEHLREALRLADSLAALRYTLGCLRCFGSLDALWARELSRSLRSCLEGLLSKG